MPIKLKENPSKEEMTKMLNQYRERTEVKVTGNKRNGAMDRKQAFGRFGR